MFCKIQQGLVGISLPSEVCSLTRASQAPNVFPFRYIQSSCNVCSIVAGNTLPVTTHIFPFTNGIMPTINSMIRLL